MDDVRGSGSEYGNFNLSCRIKQFSELNSEVGDYRSIDFMLNHDRCTSKTWVLSVFPGGKTNDSKDIVTFCLKAENTYKMPGIRFKFRLSLRSCAGKILFSGLEHAWNNSQDNEVYEKTLNRQQLLNDLEDDILIISVEVIYTCCYISGKGYFSHRATFFAEISPIAKLIDDFKKLATIKDALNSIISVDGVEIPVNSEILSIRSTVFEVMFMHDTFEKNNRRIEVTDFDEDTMKSMVEFIYSGWVQGMDIELAFKLLQASDKYDMNDLKTFCSDFLISHLDNKNVAEFLLNADTFNATKLRQKALKFYCKNVSKADFKEQRHLLLSRPELLCDIIESMKDGSKRARTDDSDNESVSNRRVESPAYRPADYYEETDDSDY